MRHKLWTSFCSFPLFGNLLSSVPLMLQPRLSIILEVRVRMSVTQRRGFVWCFTPVLFWITQALLNNRHPNAEQLCQKCVVVKGVCTFLLCAELDACF